jgi:hypothetical protein
LGVGVVDIIDLLGRIGRWPVRNRSLRMLSATCLAGGEQLGVLVHRELVGQRRHGRGDAQVERAVHVTGQRREGVGLGGQRAATLVGGACQ